jgi:capsular polysaccharide export protein
VLINSTVGLSALLHNIPTKTLGRAMYDMPGLTCQKPLEQFWHVPTPVDRELYDRYRNYLIEKSQLNGSFYGRFLFSYS